MIKKLLLTLIFINPLSAMAINEDSCKKFSEFAELTMEGRQRGRPITELISIIDRTPGDKSSIPLFRNWIISAYKQPRYSTESNKQEAITEFSNKAYIECIEYINATKEQ